MSDDEPTTIVVVPTHIEINSGGHQVIIESADSLDVVANTALQLWRATDDRALTKGYGTSVGFHTELVVEPVEEGDTGAVGFQVT